MLNRVGKVVTLASVATFTAAAPAGGQDTGLASACVNGNPAFTANDPAAAHAALGHLLWRASYKEFVALQGREGAVVAFDSIVARADRLIDAQRTGGASSLDPVVRIFRARAALARTAIAAALAADGKSLADGKVVDATPLDIGSAPGDGRVMLGPDTPFLITADDRQVAVALCAGANAASAFIKSLDDSARRDVAREYAAADGHWTLFVRAGYSMTFIERIAASCRLSVVGRVISPFRDCSTDPGRSLEPPTRQTVFLHPAAGLAPLFRGDSSYQSIAIVELYGYLHHSYSDAKITSFGLSVASGHPQVGAARMGGVLHTPWGSAGVLAGRSAKPLYVVTGDAMGWIGGIRDRMAQLRDVPLEKVMGIVRP